MFLSIKTKAIFNVIAVIFFVVFFNTQLTFSQDSSESISSPYYFGVVVGYSGLLEGSKLAESFNSKDFINGSAAGFLFDYKIPGTNSYLQFLTDHYTMNFKSNTGDNLQAIQFTSLGLKMHPRMIKDLYFTIGTGLMTGKEIETQIIMSFNLGYDFLKTKNATSYLQIGAYTADIKDIFVSVRLGIRINL